MSTTEKPPVAAKPKKATPTEYVMLVMVGPNENWQQKPETLKTIGKDAAVKAQIAIGAKTKTTYFALSAVPASSWKPVVPETETFTKTTLKPLT